MALILDGKKIRDERKNVLAKKISKLGFSPGLVIFQVGEDIASQKYIKQKEIFGDSVGVSVRIEKVSESISTEDFLKKIETENKNKNTHGIIVQLPLPRHLDQSEIFGSIDQVKDVDGLSPKNTSKLVSGKPFLMPATTRGIIDLLDFYNIGISGKKVCVVGRSELVGKPTALAFLNRDATVEICHSKTTDLLESTKRSDILITAIGKPRTINKDFVSEGQTIIDVGINIDELGNICGDVFFDDVYEIVGAITPVPGGVGPMTVLSLFENLMDSCQNRL